MQHQEKMRKKDKTAIDMAVVGVLMKNQKDINENLKGTGIRCSLYPKPDLEPCISCPIYEKCKTHKRERTYIDENQTSHKTSKRSMQKGNKENLRNETISSHSCDYADETEYPCEDFAFACEDKEACNQGINCPWKN